MKIRKVGVAFINVLVLFSAGFAWEQSHSNEQRHFSAEAGDTRAPKPLPQSVFTILKKDEHVRSVLEDQNIQPDRVPLSWFSAATVHLSNPKKADFVVMGEGPLRGANVVTFWVFQSTAHGYRLVLTAPAHDLIVKSTRCKGYDDIALISATARQTSTILYRFNGERYTEYKSESEAIK